MGKILKTMAAVAPTEQAAIIANKLIPECFVIYVFALFGPIILRAPAT